MQLQTNMADKKKLNATQSHMHTQTPEVTNTAIHRHTDTIDGEVWQFTVLHFSTKLNCHTSSCCMITSNTVEPKRRCTIGLHADLIMTLDLTSLWSASYVSCQRNTARICCCGPGLLPRRFCWAPSAGQQSIDSFCPPGAPQQTYRTLMQRSIIITTLITSNNNNHNNVYGAIILNKVIES